MERSEGALAARVAALEKELDRRTHELSEARAALARREVQQREDQEARLRQVFEAAFEGIFTLDTTGTVTFANARVEQITGFPREEVVGRPVTDFLGEADAATQPARLARRARGISEELALSVTRKDGRVVETRVAASPIIEGGVFVGAIAMVSDVTERNRSERQLRASLAEKEVLLREVHHRVKNNLQVVSSLLSLQASTVQDEAARAALDESRERIQSIALAHELLYRSHDLARVDFHAYLQQLVRVLASPFVRPEVEIDLRLGPEPLELALDLTVPCGLLINELLTNALRHGFPTGCRGRVTVACERDQQSCWLSVADDGVGVPPGVANGQQQTLGLRLVNSLVRQLGGELDVRVEQGSHFRVKFPLAPEAAG